MNHLFFLLFLLVCSTAAATVDLVVFSYNRPMQLYAFLESAEKYLKGVEETHIIFRSSDSAYDEGYEVVKARFPKAHYHRQANVQPTDFKDLVLKSVYSSKSAAPYVMFAVDDIIVTDKVDLKVCTKAMSRYHAWGFYLRMGKNITESYSMRAATPIPKGKTVGGQFFKWRFSDGKGDWSYPNSVDMTVFQKKRIESFLRNEEYIHPSSLEGRWADLGAKKLHRKGISFLRSKMINIPLNLVGPYNNRNMQSYSPAELQERFKRGQKIDISRYFRMKNRAPHVDCELTFIAR